MLAPTKVETFQKRLPRRFFKRAQEPTPQRFRQRAITKTVTKGVPHSVAALQATRQSFWLQYAADLVNVSRATHIEQTALAWRDFKSQGFLNDKVAIIVDGSVQRPIKSVKLGGQIIISDPVSLDTVYEAMGYAIKNALRIAAKHRDQGFYMDSFVVFADNAIPLDPQLFTTESGIERMKQTVTSVDPDTFFTLVNVQPYARKQEALRAPNGILRHVWKLVRRKYGNDLAARFRYYRGTGTSGALPLGNIGVKTTVTKLDRRPIMFPALNIGQPGAFNSQATGLMNSAARQKMLKKRGLT